jgi:hypothetical protein
MQDPTPLVLAKINELGHKEASKFFGVSLPTVYNWSNGKTSPSIKAALLVAPDEPVIQPFTDWEGRKVHVCLPVYKTINPKTHYSLFANYAQYGPSKIGMTVEWGTQIHVARNLLSHKFLQTDAEWSVWVDDDMGLPTGNPGIINGRFGGELPEPSASVAAFSRLMSHPAEMQLLGALYFGRHRFGAAQCSWGFDQGHDVKNDELRRHIHNKPIAMRWIAPGFSRIHRSVFEAMRKAIDEGRWPECKPKAEGRPYGFWTPLHTDAGEDVSFCLRAAEIGIQSWLDPVLECLHFGESGFGSHNTKERPNG